MGKAKPRYKNNRRHHLQNTGNTEITDLEAELGSATTEAEIAIQNVVEQVQSSHLEEKLCGLQALVALTQKEGSVEIIMKNNIIKIIAPLLLDTNIEVRNFTSGILRNLSASGTEEVCRRIVKEDIMTPLLALLERFSDWKPDSTSSDNRDTLLQVIYILWNLCENDDSVLKYFNSPSLLNILLKCLNLSDVGIELSIVACQCLQSATEDNASVATVLRRHETDLFHILSHSANTSELVLLKTLVAGIIVNLNSSSGVRPAVLSVLKDTLSEDLRKAAANLSSQLPLDSSTSSLSAPPLAEEVQKALDSTTALVAAQTSALEILTNLTASQDDEMDVESEDSESDEDMVNGWREAEESQLLTLNPEIQEGIQKHDLVQAVLCKAESLPENVMEIFINCPHSRMLAKKIVRLQCRAFLCFNNLVSVLDIEALGGPQYLTSLVKQFSTQKTCVNFQQNKEDYKIELLEASTAAIRAILLRLASIKFTDFGEIHPSDLEATFNMGLTPEPRVQANVIRIVGSLGVLLLNRDILLVKMAGSYLLEAAEKHTTLWLIAEAIDCLMNMFAEDATDQAAAEINLVSRLQAFAPRLKAKVRQERRMLGDHYSVVSTVMANLKPFIKYKGARVAALR